MPSTRIGYVRVSSFDQNPERQLDGLLLDKVFIDKASGKDIKRPQLAALLEYVREGDHIIIHSMDRLARNLDDLRRLVSELTAKQITVEFIKEGLSFSDEDKPMSKLLLSVMGAFSEFERSLIRERQLEGIALAKKRGAYKGRKAKLSEEEIAEIQQRKLGGQKKSALARKYGVTRQTIYNYLKKS